MFTKSILRSESISLTFSLDMAFIIVKKLELVQREHVFLRMMIDSKTLFGNLSEASFNSEEKPYE